jgi:hypothetical protein
VTAEIRRLVARLSLPEGNPQLRALQLKAIRQADINRIVAVLSALVEPLDPPVERADRFRFRRAAWSDGARWATRTIQQRVHRALGGA